MITPDLTEARRFIDMIAPDGNALFQTFDDDEERKARRLARTTRDFGELTGLNEKRAGIFITVNAIDGAKRGTSHVTIVRALFADFDGVDLPTEWEIEPSVIVNTSPGKFHVYWLCEGFPKEEFEAAQKAIAARYGTDPVVHDLSRVMRIPGFWHQKKGAYQAKIVEATGEMHDVETLRAWIARIAPKPEPKPRSEYKPATHLNGGTLPYVKKAYSNAFANIAASIPNSTDGNGRNVVLNREAHGLFGLVKGGYLPETVRSDLFAAALAKGLKRGEIEATLDSAWGKAEARHPPEHRSKPIEFLRRDDPEPSVETHDDPTEKPQPQVRRAENMPFRMLGHNRGTYFYLPSGGGQVVALKAHEHTALRLLALAPLTYWEGLRMNADTNKVTEYQWQQIANGLIQSQIQEGIFEEIRLRGRGAWMDAKRVIVHTGSEVIVDGEPTSVTRVNSRFVYEAAPPWEFGFGDAAETQEAYRLVEICERLTWEDPLSGSLLAGWCVVAPVSGALAWRPHIWISGPSGSGKTTAQNDIVGRVVGPAAIKFEGKTTEASIRQNLGFDARPVIMDEAEGEDQDSARRMQGVLDLARVASSGGVISKGSASHRAVNFVVRSCFCFSSIHASIRHHADESRITRLGLRKNAVDADAHYRELIADINRYFTTEYASRMFARTVKYLPVLLKNSQVFTSSASILLKSRRAADQLGPMLAGLYLCHSAKEVTADTAEKFIAKHEWADHLALDSQSDEYRLFSYVMSRNIRVMTNDGPREMTIGQAVEDGSYAKELGALGIRISGQDIWIANTSDRLSELLRDKPQWQADWKRSLILLPGAKRNEKPEYFAPGLVQRATVLSRGLLR